MTEIDEAALEKLLKEYRPTMDKDVLHHWAGDFVKAVKDHLSAAPTPPAQGVAEPMGYLHEIREPACEGVYQIYSRSSDDPWSHWRQPYRGTCVYACTPLYALPPAAPIADHAEPVAWRWRWLQGNTQWHVVSQLPDLSGVPVEKEPLYATPPVADHAGMVEARLALEHIASLRAPGDCRNSIEAEMKITAEEALAILSAAPKAAEQAGTVIKPLEWKARGKDEYADTPCGRYEVGLVNGAYIATVRIVIDGQCDDEVFARGLCAKREAKAAAQADFERRILSALSAPQPVERDAIRAEVIEECAEAAENILKPSEYDGQDTDCYLDTANRCAAAIRALGREGQANG